jgi:hypothetical protein
MSRWVFTAAGVTAPFSGMRLPAPAANGAGAWFTVPTELKALDGDDLASRVDEELWELELRPGSSDEVRLVRRIGTWSPPVAVAFGRACVQRARDRAVLALEPLDPGSAAELRVLDEPAAIEAWVAARADSVPEPVRFAADVASLSFGRRPDSWRTGDQRQSAQPPAVLAANVAFVVAHGAGLERAQAAGGDYADGVAAERAWQAQWLRETLGLS